MRTIRQVHGKGNGQRLGRAVAPEVPAVNARLAAIQALIPLGLAAVAEELEAEVTRLAGPRYAQADGAGDRVWWGRQRGSLYLADQKLPVQVPRVIFTSSTVRAAHMGARRKLCENQLLSFWSTGWSWERGRSARTMQVVDRLRKRRSSLLGITVSMLTRYAPTRAST
ncbi:MAG: hypothetical protein HY560_05470 [Gemmatimonadetes bacterium]|nr:hypothetical protein [Gemmatimonadota bacterium]